MGRQDANYTGGDGIFHAPDGSPGARFYSPDRSPIQSSKGEENCQIGAGA